MMMMNNQRFIEHKIAGLIFNINFIFATALQFQHTAVAKNSVLWFCVYAIHGPHAMQFI
jgi:hypothetical protein